MNSNIIAFDRARKVDRPAETVVRVAGDARGAVVSLSEWRNRSRPRRTASGVFFTTGVLATYGTAA